jgi:hypothetical protein
MNPETKWIGVFSALVLLIGIFLGIAMDRFLFRPSPEPVFLPPHAARDIAAPRPARRLAARLARALDLTESQKIEMGEIFRRHLPRLRKARRRGGRFEAVRREMHAEIEKLLNPEQLRRFEELSQRQRDFRKRIRDRMKEESSPSRGAE